VTPKDSYLVISLANYIHPSTTIHPAKHIPLKEHLNIK